MQTGPDLTTVQPDIDATLSGNAVQVGWGWGGNTAFLDRCEIQVDRGSGWTLLAFDTTPMIATASEGRQKRSLKRRKTLPQLLDQS